ncbi:MAG: ABC transporter permease [Rhodobacteraceae bacterium]|nr:ABC transporter permease [Paracoccaceae bacterium]
MEPLTWTGILGPVLNPLLMLVAAALVLAALTQIILSFVPAAQPASGVLGDRKKAAIDYSRQASLICLGAVVLVILAYIVGGLLVSGTGAKGIIGAISTRLLPVWISLIVLFGVSIRLKARLGLYGKLFDSPVGMIGFAIVMFWVFTAFYSGVFGWIATHDPLSQLSGMKNKPPGTPVRTAEEGAFQYYLLGGDTLARDVFSRVVHGSSVVLQIAPLATFFGYIVGITLGLPAGYYTGNAMRWGTAGSRVVAAVLAGATIAVILSSGVLNGLVLGAVCIVIFGIMLRTTLDTLLSFVANLILAFPVILLFYLLVTPEIIQTGLPNYLAAVFFLFPIIFMTVLINSRFHIRPAVNYTLLGLILAGGFWVYFSTVSESGRGTLVDFWPAVLDLFDIPAGVLVVFISVVFVNSPTIFRIMRGLTLDVKSRDYVAAARTRGETPWYIMLWEILPNVRGPLIVDFCLRIGYATILLGTLGFFGLGLPPESPDWGSTINEGRKLLSVYLHPVLPPALSLLSLVLGLNLTADGLREQSLRE